MTWLFSSRKSCADGGVDRKAHTRRSSTEWFRQQRARLSLPHKIHHGCSWSARQRKEAMTFQETMVCLVGSWTRCAKVPGPRTRSFTDRLPFEDHRDTFTVHETCRRFARHWRGQEFRQSQRSAGHVPEPPHDIARRGDERPRRLVQLLMFALALPPSIRQSSPRFCSRSEFCCYILTCFSA